MTENLRNPVILVINPGSTSTRTAVFRGQERLAERHLECSREELAACGTAIGQVLMRTKHVLDFLAGLGPDAAKFDAVAARGGPLRPVPGGTYRVNAAMLDDARSDRFVEHVSKIACIIADTLARQAGTTAFVVDPISTDEFDAISRISGLRELHRKPLTHALNMKAAARLFAGETGKPYEQLNLIVAHLGGGCSISVHSGGRMIDSVDANGEGPFSPHRSGGLRTDDLARFVLESGRNFHEIRGILTHKAGLFSHLGTDDAREVVRRIENGDAAARLVFEAMAYSIAKHICALAAAVAGRVDGILLTGGLANAKMLTDWIAARVGFLGPVRVMPGEREMEALRDGAARVLSGLERPKIYPSGESE
ncbi:MAG: butyrate kinase [Planctomycetes bacterium]|nr:butyrate kinase [Planctomycetota bacterium]